MILQPIYRLYLSLNRRFKKILTKAQNKFLNNKIKTKYYVKFEYNARIADIEKIDFGKNVFIGENAFIRAGGGIKIGNNVIISRNVLIYTLSHNYNGKYLPYDNTFIKKKVTIEDNVWIGMNVAIAPGTHIEEGSIIGIGARIFGRIKKGSIIGSNGKLIKYRDLNHYETLKSKRLFADDSGYPLKDNL